MKVFFLTYPTAFQRPGGGETTLLSLRDALTELGVEVVLFDPWTHGLEEGDVIHYFSSVGTDLFPHLRSHLPLVVTPTIWPKLPTHVRYERLLRGGMKRLLGRASVGPYSSADRVTPHSKLEAELLIQNYGVRGEQIRVIPHGVATTFARPSDGRFAALHSLGPYVLCYGRIDPNKNQLALIRALNEVDVDLVLLGDAAPGDEDYLAACRAAAGPRARFVPALPAASDLLVDAVSGAAVVAIPSIYEIWSMSAHEAAVAGVAIACTRSGPMPELLGPWAQYFDPTSVDEIRSAVVAALSRGRSPEQIEHFRRRLSWDAVAREMRSIYEGLGDPTTR